MQALLCSQLTPIRAQCNGLMAIVTKENGLKVIGKALEDGPVLETPMKVNGNKERLCSPVCSQLSCTASWTGDVEIPRRNLHG